MREAMEGKVAVSQEGPGSGDLPFLSGCVLMKAPGQ